MSRPARTDTARRAAQIPLTALQQDRVAATDTRSLNAQGRLGVVQFFLQRVTGGLYVEREEIPKRGLRTMQSTSFADADSFNRWCDADPVRFEHPLLHAQLKREGDELLRSGAKPAQR